MKKFAIVCCKSDKVLHSYSADELNPSTFGGPWGDERTYHIEIKEDSYETPIEDLEIRDVQIQDGTQMVLMGQVEAKDSKGESILNAQGEPVMIDDYEEQPVYKTVKMAVKK